ncbi:unnamed protein product [Closterium sp. Yama58-4]|nr:unnamed protein product [Closterium sp. Yama58-4]
MSGADETPASSSRIPGFSLAAVGVTSFGGEGFQLGQLSPGADPVDHEEAIAAQRASEEERWQKAMDDMRAERQQSPTERRDPTWTPGNADADAASDGESGGEDGGDRANIQPTDADLDPIVEAALCRGEPGLVKGMFGALNNDSRRCLMCNTVIGWRLGNTSSGARHVKRTHYPSLQIWVRRFLDPNKPDSLAFRDGGWGATVPDRTKWPWEHAATWPDMPAAETGAGPSGLTGGAAVPSWRAAAARGLGHAMVIDFRPLEGRHTGDKIAKELEEVIGEWALGGGEFFGVTTDNAEKNNRAIRLLCGVADETPGSRPCDPPVMSLARHFKCVAHVLNLAVQHTIKIEPVAEALRRLRAVASYIGWSVQRSERFFDIQKRYAATVAGTQAKEGAEEDGERQAEGGTAEEGARGADGGGTGRKRPTDLRLIVDSDTRWGSTLEMVVRGCELSIPLTMYFDESSIPNIRQTTRTAWAEIRLSDAHWTALNELRAFLEPFDSITLFVEGSLYPTMGAVVPQYNMLLDILEANKVSPFVSQLFRDLSTRALTKLERHMGRVSEECAVATFLDPRLKTATFRLRARGARPTAPVVVAAGGHAMGARTLDLTEERVKALVRERLPPYQIAARAAAEARLGGEVTSARGVTGEGAERSGAAERRSARSRGVLDFQARLFAELAEMEAEEGVRAQDEVDQYLAEARQEGGCALAYWRGRELQLPGLRALARDYLAS